jgi:hypothetical protein
MKRCLFVVLFALTFLFFGLQPAFCKADPQNRGNAAPGEALPEELGGLDVKDYYLGSEAEPVGLIQTVTGHVVVLHGDTNEAYFGAQGDAIFKQDVFFTLEDSRCRIKFSTEDVITMAAESQISVDELVDDRDLKKKESAISMLKGKAMFYVVPLFRYKDTSASVETPTAICGVRGTKFGVGIREDAQTMVYGFEGNVEVYSPVDGTSQMVGQGQNLQLTGMGAGDVQPMSHDIAEHFMLETEAPVPEEKPAVQGDYRVGEQAEAKEESAEQEGAAEEEPTAEEEGAAQDEGSVDQEGGPEGETPEQKDDGPDPNFPVFDPKSLPEFPVDPNNPIDPKDFPGSLPDPTDPPVDPEPAMRWGYLTGMLTRGGASKTFAHLYLSDSLQDLQNGPVEGRDLLGQTGTLYIVSDGAGPTDNPAITSVQVDKGAVTYMITGSFPVVSGEPVGHNAYVEWGYWTQPIGMFDGANNYYFDNRGYYIAGDYTPAAQMSELALNNVSGTYTGDAHGTYWTETGGANMFGTFSADVSFASGSISNFTVGVSGDGHSVVIDGASGGFTSGSQFEINAATGTWQMDGNLAETGKKEARGSMYGPNAEAIGGVWKLDNDLYNAHATGMFQGTREFSRRYRKTGWPVHPPASPFSFDVPVMFER